MYTVTLTEVIGLGGLRTYLVAADGFFTAPEDPYVNPTDPTKPVDPIANPDNLDRLTEDALFFCAVVPQALVRLGVAGELVLHLHDWETACAVLAVERDPNIKPVASILTLHNAYDCYLGNTTSPLVRDLVAHLGLQSDNVLTQTIPLMDGPIASVSRNFARELTSDPLQTRVFADHLQSVLRSKGIVGIDNGPFGDVVFSFSERAQREASRGKFDCLSNEKLDRRRQLNVEVAKCKRQIEVWGDVDVPQDSEGPVFLMSGRNDLCQKGFDVVAEAIRSILEEKLSAGKRALYIFTPLLGTEGLAGLTYLKDLAEEYPEDVGVFPGALDPSTYSVLARGSSFLVMASFYEPFGSASEAYLAGTPVIARATGGLVEQVVSYPYDGLGSDVKQLSDSFHADDSLPTGFLYHEDPIVDTEQNWRSIIHGAHDARRGNALFDAMVSRAKDAIVEASQLYCQSPEEYARMIYAGYEMLDRFGWPGAVQEYRHLYKLPVSGRVVS
jgi:glycogen synthase